MEIPVTDFELHTLGITLSGSGKVSLAFEKDGSDLIWSKDVNTKEIRYGENFMVAVQRKDTGEMIGEIVVMPNDGCISLGYTFSYNHHRKGYAYEALSTLIDTLHSRFPDMEFICFTEPENTASIALLKKLGYTDYGYVDKITSNVFGKWIVDDPLK